MELISRKALIEELKKSRKYHAQNGRELELLCRCENIVNEQPTVEAVPVVHGEWKKAGMHHVQDYYKCTVCGADMRKKV